MSSFLILLLVAGFVAACIWLLHKNQRRRLLDTVERTAPLPALQDQTLPDFGTAEATAAPLIADSFPAALSTDADAAPIADADTGADAENASAAGSDNWLARIKTLREANDTHQALALCIDYAPRVQAFQQAAIILRGQIREQLDQRLPADALLHDLYRTAVLADVFRTTNPRKPADPEAALATLLAQDFPYQKIGHRQLKLLNKSDVRLLEQVWGAPAAHRHAEDVLGTLS